MAAMRSLPWSANALLLLLIFGSAMSTVYGARLLSHDVLSSQAGLADVMEPKLQDDPIEAQHEAIEAVVSALTRISADHDSLQRMLLTAGTYPPPPLPSSSPSPTPPSPASPPPRRPRSPPPPPSPYPEDIKFVAFENMPGQGAISISAEDGSKQVVWRSDPVFTTLRTPRSPLNLIYNDKHLACNSTKGVCAFCPRAWTAEPSLRAVPIYFREPVQLDSISILQLQNPGVTKVQLLPWPATSIPELPTLAPKSGVLGKPVWTSDEDKTVCGSSLEISIPNSRSGTDLNVNPNGSQENIPDKLVRTVVGGIMITVKQQPKGNNARAVRTVIESVLFSGRVLYPRDPNAYKSSD